MKSFVFEKMQNGLLTLIAVVICAFISCTSDDAPGAVVEIKELNADGHDKEYVADEGRSRSSLTFNREYKGMIFSWDYQDRLTVFANATSTRCDYHIQSINPSRPNSAKFSGTGFTLTQDLRYFALSKTEETATKETRISDKNNIILSYKGQRMTANASDSHLGSYDYMVSSGISPNTDAIQFTFEHLGATLRLVFYAEGDMFETFKAKEFVKLELYDSENTFRNPLRPFSFPEDLKKEDIYEPQWPEDESTSTERFAVDLGTVEKDQEGHDVLHGITPFATNTNGDYEGDLVVYIEVPPVDLRNNSLGYILTASDGTKYYGSSANKNIQMGKYYQFFVQMTPTTDYNTTIKVNRLWQHGNTLDSRSTTGDPGYDETLEKPKYLYMFYCAKGEHDAGSVLKEYVVIDGVKTDNESTTHIHKNLFPSHPQSTIPESDWSEESDGDILAYANSYVFQNNGSVTEPRVYVVASMKPLTFPALTVETTTEADIKAMTYEISAGGSTQEDTQAFLKDLYSTPFGTDGVFSGDLTDPMQTVFLYHTAAKVDLQWNSSTALPITTPDNNIKVDNVLATGLKLFTPTENTYSESGTYNVSTPITEGTKYNGRQVYYLPQFSNADGCKYKVTIGDKPGAVDGESNPIPVNFSTVPVSGGYTSWLRWLKKY